MSLSEKSDEEITKLPADGVKHGAIVDSTGKLYEKKLEKVMEDTPVKPSSDKTYYREEEEVVTYMTYHSPVRHEGYADMLKRRGNTEPDEEEESDQDQELSIQSSSRTVSHSAEQSRKLAGKSGGCMWKVIRLLLLLAVLAAVFYYTYFRVMNSEQNLF